MKIKKSQLRQIIDEELNEVLPLGIRLGIRRRRQSADAAINTSDIEQMTDEQLIAQAKADGLQYSELRGYVDSDGDLTPEGREGLIAVLKNV